MMPPFNLQVQTWIMLGLFAWKAISQLFGSNLVLNQMKGETEAICMLWEEKRKKVKSLSKYTIQENLWLLKPKLMQCLPLV